MSMEDLHAPLLREEEAADAFIPGGSGIPPIHGLDRLIPGDAFTNTGISKALRR